MEHSIRNALSWCCTGQSHPVGQPASPGTLCITAVAGSTAIYGPRGTGLQPNSAVQVSLKVAGESARPVAGRWLVNAAGALAVGGIDPNVVVPLGTAAVTITLVADNSDGQRLSEDFCVRNC